MNDLQEIAAGFGAVISFIIATLSPLFNNTVNALTSQVTHNSTLEHNQSEYIIAQAQTASNCRRVNTYYGLNVRQEPSLNSATITRLAYGTRVLIINRGSNGWVPIYNPAEGYVYGANLAYCEAPPPLNSCRRINALFGANVRRNPSLNSPVIRTLSNGTTVKIINRGSNVWIPINSPVKGYLAAGNLVYCSAQ